MIKNKGQGLLEMIIALGVIIAGLVGGLSLAVASLQAGKLSETYLVASNLAREGVEVVRSIRDNNWLAGEVWDKGLEGDNMDYTGIVVFKPLSNQWTIDFTANSINDSSSRLYRQGGLYLQDVNPPSGLEMIYYRLITIDEICDNGEVKTSGEGCLNKIGIKVVSEVKWTEGKRTHNLKVEDRLFNWK